MPSSDFPMPYTSRLNSPLAPGQTLIFQGSIDSNARHFELSLISGVPNSGQEQIALQICFHFEIGITVLNSMLGGDEWGEEEFHSNPFFHGKPFDVRIRVHEDKFDILTNQMPWATFRHCMDFRQINHIQASGDVSLGAVHWGGRYFEVPYEMSFHDHALESGQRVFIYGIPKGDFAVSLTGVNSDDLFRMSAHFDNQIVVRNAQTDKEWGAEESDGTFPFRNGEGFDLVILNEPLALQVSVNGLPFCSFFHRTKDIHKDYKKLRICGEVELTGVEDGRRRRRR
uniref:Galectin n=1 Tax=Globodera pallida TaxID=36090 RepID=A0A183BM65_GLOPA